RRHASKCLNDRSNVGKSDLLAARDSSPDRGPVQAEERREPHAVLEDVDVSRASVAFTFRESRSRGADECGEARAVPLLRSRVDVRECLVGLSKRPQLESKREVFRRKELAISDAMESHADTLLWAERGIRLHDRDVLLLDAAKRSRDQARFVVEV